MPTEPNPWTQTPALPEVIHRQTAAGAGPTLGTEAASSGPRGEAAGTETPPAQANLDDFVEKAWRKFMRKLAVEQERRGLTR